MSSTSSKHRTVGDKLEWWFKWIEIEWRWLESKLGEVEANIEMGSDLHFCLDWSYLSFIWGKFEETFAFTQCWNICRYSSISTFIQLLHAPSAPPPPFSLLSSNLPKGRPYSNKSWALRQNITSQYLCSKFTFFTFNWENNKQTNKPNTLSLLRWCLIYYTLWVFNILYGISIDFFLPFMLIVGSLSLFRGTNSISSF